MMSWWHQIQDRPFLGEFKEDSNRILWRKDGMWDRFIIFDLIHPNPKLDDRE